MDSDIIVRDYAAQMVIKHSDLIQKARYYLSAKQQKVLLFMISQINYEEEYDPDKFYTIGLYDFYNICGVEYNSGKNYNEIKNIIKSIADKSSWVKFDNSEMLIRWVDEVFIVQGDEQYIKYRFTRSISPYLYELNRKYTMYKLKYALALNGKYSIRLYEILKSYEWIGSITIDFDDIKNRINCEEYTFYDFKRRILEKSVNEINSNSDIIVDYSYIKKQRGKGISAISFKITPKQSDAAPQKQVAAPPKKEYTPNTYKNPALNYDQRTYTDADFEDLFVDLNKPLTP